MTNAGLLDLWTEPQERECLSCYVSRLLADFGCDGTLRWTRRWRGLRAPRVVALDRMFRRRAVNCDCGVPAALGAGTSSGTPPPCTGVRRGSTRPCSMWGRPDAPGRARGSPT
ncbi:DUF2695 domain-containing protein [Amycolatopsis sp. ATCC 39116]|uniref:DUF2695 domain-containing protein n=1 Tax=Amycolatopsis sp. (strain ATCC 39116 / 75iv2) TaxID=385957 RepID=UPI00026262E1|nr:DUF2695 domain-containing protein [Amycolatopsis sp. ATCC 39116]